jgi:hypothetical protein
MDLPQPSLFSLPQEVFEHILALLDPKSLFSAVVSCKAINRISTEAGPLFWSKFSRSLLGLPNCSRSSLKAILTNKSRIAQPSKIKMVPYRFLRMTAKKKKNNKFQ